jgi:hypothetical protein
MADSHPVDSSVIENMFVLFKRFPQEIRNQILELAFWAFGRREVNGIAKRPGNVVPGLLGANSETRKAVLKRYPALSLY